MATWLLSNQLPGSKEYEVAIVAKQQSRNIHIAKRINIFTIAYAIAINRAILIELWTSVNLPKPLQSSTTSITWFPWFVPNIHRWGVNLDCFMAAMSTSMVKSLEGAKVCWCLCDCWISMNATCISYTAVLNKMHDVWMQMCTCVCICTYDYACIARSQKQAQDAKLGIRMGMTMDRVYNTQYCNSSPFHPSKSRWMCFS